MTNNQATDSDANQWLNLARNGDRDALGRLLEFHRDYLVLLSRRQQYQQQQVAFGASDVVQETFLRAHANFSQFRGTTQREFAAWLRQILARSIVTLARQQLGIRRKNNLRERQLSELLDQSSQAIGDLVIAPDASPSSMASRNEQAVLFAKAIQELPEQYREVICLRHLQGLPFVEVASQMNRSVDSVEKLWIRALCQLRSTLQKYS